ncbi:MAG: DsrE/DsrF/TusD sulfur relay family protein [Candidatus Hodarchaeales archaeon]|jgi:tRNA 2-thiouridine synthesizing protein D
MKLGLMITGSPFDSSRWLTGYRIAKAALEKGHEVLIYLYLDGTNIPVKSQTIHGHEELLPYKYYQELCDLGADIMSCSVCTDARGHEHGKRYFEHTRLKVVSILDLSAKIGKCDNFVSL